MSDFVKGKTLELTVEMINHFGIGVAKKENLLFEIPKSYPGERLLVQLEEKFYPKTWRCRIEKVLQPAKERVLSQCGNSNYCQGCSSDFIDYQQQLSNKNERVKKYFPEAGDILPSPLIWHYRTTASFIFKKEKHKIIVNSPAKGSLDSFNLENCQIVPEVFNPILETIKNLANQFEFSVYNPVIQKGYYIGFDLKYSFSENKIMLAFISQPGEMKHQKEIINALAGKHPEILSIYHVIKTGKKLDHQLIFGERFLVEKLEKLGIKYKIKPQTLFYANLYQVENFFEWIMTQAKFNARKVLLDLYSGIGLSSLILSKKNKLVYGVERNSNAVREAVSNAKMNQAENIIFIEQGIETLKVEDDIFNEEIEAVFSKFPQELPENIFEILKTKEIPKIILASSSAESLYKEVQKLKKLDYVLMAVQPFDFYPHSFQFEIGVILQKRRKIIVKKKA